ncbi:hypothetical protein [Microbacterium sp. C7(2022)]|uniref:hypothetical protein n=1 Tax=Microbacterium sp. C7(2022) TaxID=2992759 RepID=UPI00237BA15C|nr:hypothetical protein [Microbacterium sp. C7(2022)]MDE0545316.1 DUF11 domain-containing protein [Microbacterium sp. C7(2022)]
MRTVIAAAVSLTLAVGASIGFAAPAAATLAEPTGTQVCAPYDSGKVNVSGSHKTLTLSAPDGKLISGYCVKAGSTQQGNGPVFVTVDPAQKSVTISHPSGKDISHYALVYTTEGTPTADKPIQTLACDTITVDYRRPLVNGDHINLEFTPAEGGGNKQVNLYVDRNIAGGYDTLGLRMPGGQTQPLTEAEVRSGVITWTYSEFISSVGGYTVAFVQTNETDTWPKLDCTTEEEPECPEGTVEQEDGSCEEPPTAETYVDLGIVKTHSDLGEENTVDYSTEFSYFLEVTNHGTATVTAGVVTDEVPTGLTVTSVIVPGGWTDETVDNTVKVSNVVLAPEASGIIEVKVVVEDAHDYTAPDVSVGESDPQPQLSLEGAFTNEACVDAPFDVNPDNDCSEVVVERDELVANVFVRCINDAPYLYYSVETSPSLAGKPITLTWAPVSQPAVPASQVLTLDSGDSGRIVWPGAEFASNGNSILWPGYRPLVEADYNADGTLAIDPSLVYNGLVLDTSHETYPWRGASTVTFSVNPTLTVSTSYPSASPNCSIPRAADMTVTKTASVETVQAGDSFDYNLAVANVSVDGAADPVTITDVIPSDIRVDEITTDTTAFPRWTGCDVADADSDGFGGVLTCSLFGPLMMGESAPTITLGVTVADDTSADRISNTAEVCWAGPDDAELIACNDDTADVTREPTPVIDLGIEKTHSDLPTGTVDPGDEFSYFLEVTNNGTVAVDDGVVTDEVPSSLEVLEVITPVGTSVGSGNDVEITGVALDVDASVIIEVRVRVIPNAVDAVPNYAAEEAPAAVSLSGPIENTACVAVTGDADASNDCSTVEIERDEIAANVWMQCINDAPYLYYSVQTSPSLQGEPITLTWTPDTQPAVPSEVTLTLESGDSGRIVWPGADFAANDVSILWPGYRALVESDYNADGTLAVDPALVYNGLVLDTDYETYPWRLGSTVTLSVNPTLTLAASYPAATANCAVPRSADMQVTKTASASSVSPGESFDYTLAVENVSVDAAADPVVITDMIPADIRVDEITTDATAFPRWDDCELTGTDADGFGGMVECHLFGPLATGASAPDITLEVTVASDVTVGTISNTAEVCWGGPDDGGEIVACNDDSASVTITQPLAVTGGTAPLAMGMSAAIVMLLGASAFFFARSRRQAGAAS